MVWYATLSVARSPKSTHPPRIGPSKKRNVTKIHGSCLYRIHTNLPRRPYWPLTFSYTFTTKCPDDAFIQTWPQWTCETDLGCHLDLWKELPVDFNSSFSALWKLVSWEVPLEFYAHCFFTLIPHPCFVFILLSVLCHLCGCFYCCCRCCWMSFCFLFFSLPLLLCECSIGGAKFLFLKKDGQNSIAREMLPCKITRVWARGLSPLGYY